MREFLEKYGLRLLIITTVCAVLISVLSFVSATSGFLQNAVGVLTYPVPLGGHGGGGVGGGQAALL